jgi:hypothetical protein
VKSTANSSLHQNIDVVETFPKIGGNTGDMPTKTESNVFIGGAAKFETASGGDVIEMSDQAKDVNPTMTSSWHW